MNILKKLSLSFSLFFFSLSGASCLAAPPRTLLTDQEWQTVEQSFGPWLTQFRQQAAQAGISEHTFNSALDNAIPLRRVVELDRAQPELTMTFAQYRRHVVAPRINMGRKLMRLHASQLTAVQKQYGVDPQYVVALWGMETSFGANTGGFNVPHALATLAVEGRRRDLFTAELLAALKIIDRGDISAADMTGSWAGAMGQNQFMPSTFLALAVDADGDGHRNIWSSHHLPDMFASTANKLVSDGWQPGGRWGRAAVIPKNFPREFISLDVTKPLKEWKRLGVRLPGHALPASDTPASLITPGMNKKTGYTGGPVFLVYNNYRTILKWNNSSYFATAFGLLADAIAKPASFSR